MKHVGILESNTSGSGFDAMRAAKEIGCTVTFFTSGLERYHAAPGGTDCLDRYVDDIVLTRTNALEPLRRAVRQVHRERPMAGFFSLAEYEVADAAVIAEELGLPSPGPEAVRTARNKIEMRRRCAAHGVPAPRFSVVNGPDEVAAALAEVGLPCVVKPADETSSAGVRRCSEPAEAIAQVRTILGQKLNLRGQLRHPQVLIEQYLSGIEVSVEILATDEGLTVLGVTDKWVGGSDRFVELGHAFPSALPEPIQRGCADVAVRAGRALGLRLGMLHVEVRHTAGGPRLIEVNPRPAGDRIHELVDISMGGSCLELVVRQYLGERVDDLVPRSARHAAAIRFLIATPGRVSAIDGLEAARGLPGVLAVEASVSVGGEISPLTRNEDRAGHVLTAAADAYLATRIADAAAHEVTIRTTATPTTGGPT